MDFNKNSLTVCSYNCQSFNDGKVPFIKQLLDKSDFILIQEHCKYEEQLSEFNSLGDICYHGCSSMDISQQLIGRPHGGCAIIWSENCIHKTTAVQISSNRLCAVTITLQDHRTLLLVNCYMPCDDRTRGARYNALLDTINELENLILTTNADFILIGGDLNSDLNRVTHHVNAIREFASVTNLSFGINHVLSNVDFTFESKGSGTRSTIDHFMLDSCLFGIIKYYDTFSSVENLSDHNAVLCELDLDVKYLIQNKDRVYTPNPAWYKASLDDCKTYKACLDYHLSKISIPTNVFTCHNVHCKEHFNEIEKLHNDIIKACLNASESAIPKTGRAKTKTIIPGWSEFVKGKREDAYFWYNLWRDNGSPRHGELANVMKHTKRIYHYAIRYCKRHEDQIKSTRMAEALSSNSTRRFWNEVKKVNSSKNKVSAIVDGETVPTAIAGIFQSKFQSLYTSVGYCKTQMDDIKSQVDGRLANGIKDILDINQEVVNFQDIIKAIGLLKKGKSDGLQSLSTDCLLNGTYELYHMLAELFKCILIHGYMPSETLLGCMTPIPKDKAATRFSEKYRAITLSSVIGKLFDLVILEREGKRSLRTDNQQFGFKPGCSTTLCTGMLRETITHFVNNGSDVYGLFLDASKAFDRIDYVKLFSTLNSKKMNPIYVRCLLHMYCNQKLCVRWNGVRTDNFSTSNGVKQGGILSPLLFSTYIDGMLQKLRESGLGCYVGPHFCAAFGYADDICLLSPTRQSLQSMITICEDYAKDFKITFNGAKSQLVRFRAPRQNTCTTRNENVVVEGEFVYCRDSALHLGHMLFADILVDDRENVIKQFYKQYNGFRCRFQKVSSEIKNELFSKYCTSFYGVQLCDLQKLSKLHTSHRKCLRKVWDLPNRTHNVILPGLSGQLCSSHMCSKRFLKYAKLALEHDFPAVQYVFKNSLKQRNSIFKRNMNFCGDALRMNVDDMIAGDVTYLTQKLCRTCQETCQKPHIVLTYTISELIAVRDSLSICVLTRTEAKVLLNELCIN